MSLSPLACARVASFVAFLLTVGAVFAAFTDPVWAVVFGVAAAVYALVAWHIVTSYRRLQYDLRARHRATQRLLRDLRGTSAVKVYDVPSVEELARGWYSGAGEAPDLTVKP